MNPLTPTTASTGPIRTSHEVTLRPWPPAFVCFVLASLWFGATVGLRPLAIPDEGRYVGVAWEMLRSGDWTVPTLNGAPFFHKPPLFYWITAASMQLLGPGVGAARAAAWLGAVLTTTGLFAFVRRWIGTSAAWASVVVLSTLPLFYGGAQYANLDMLVAACIAAAILLTAHATLSREHGARYQRALAMAFVAAACGVLAKGLIGAVIPALVMLAWGLATQRASKVLTLLVWAPGWLLFTAIAAPWFIVMQQRFPGFAHYFFVVQQAERFASSGFNNPQPIWFYAGVLLALSLPWSPWLLRLTRRTWWLETRPGANGDVRTLMLTWLAVVLVFFSIPGSKLVGYILPALTPLAFLIADAARAMPRGWRRPSVALAAAVCLGAALAAHFYQPKSREALALQLKSFRLPDEPVIFVGNYYYDVAFYARLTAPVFVVDEWRADAVAQDSWRRELVDAERFAGQHTPRHLVRPDDFAPTLCRSAGAWVIGPWPPAPTPAWLAAQPPAYQSGMTALWHIEPARPALHAALGCDLPPAVVSSAR
ncbi:MAG: glycosyltransferase family 39 protein [Burkholderiales bacterium]